MLCSFRSITCTNSLKLSVQLSVIDWLFKPITFKTIVVPEMLGCIKAIFAMLITTSVMFALTVINIGSFILFIFLITLTLKKFSAYLFECDVGFMALRTTVLGLAKVGFRKYKSSNLVQKLIESTNVQPSTSAPLLPNPC
jgi:hypothetical protein